MLSAKYFNVSVWLDWICLRVHVLRRVYLIFTLMHTVMYKLGVYVCFCRVCDSSKLQHACMYATCTYNVLYVHEVLYIFALWCEVTTTSHVQRIPP